MTNPPRLAHYTAKSDHTEALKGVFPDYKIGGDDAGEGGINYFKDTDATKSTCAGTSSRNTPAEPWRTVYLNVGDAGKVYWVERSRLRDGKKLGTTTDECCGKQPCL